MSKEEYNRIAAHNAIAKAESMTPYRLKVLRAIANNPNEGIVGVGIAMDGYQTTLQSHNLFRACEWLREQGYIDHAETPSLTAKGTDCLRVTATA
jgi:hypothetical protein